MPSLICTYSGLYKMLYAHKYQSDRFCPEEPGKNDKKKEFSLSLCVMLGIEHRVATPLYPPPFF